MGLDDVVEAFHCLGFRTSGVPPVPPYRWVGQWDWPGGPLSHLIPLSFWDARDKVGRQRHSMTRRTIAGALDLSALARLHAPRTAEELHSAIRELHAGGHGDYVIASATELSVDLVRRFLGEGASGA